MESPLQTLAIAATSAYVYAKLFIKVTSARQHR